MKFSGLSLVIFAALHPMLAAASTVAVGNCRPHLVSYHTISDAVAAVPAGSTVLVCPGTYQEQVTITNSLTLRGTSPIAISPAVVTMPASPVIVDNVATQIFVLTQPDTAPPAVVNIENIVVDGSGLNNAVGISYTFASGQLSQLELRNQSVGIEFGGDLFQVDTVNLLNSYVHNFSNTGVFAASNGATGFFLNMKKNLVQSNITTVQSGVEYFFGADGVASQNTILVNGGTGLWLVSFFPGMTAKGNIIDGASIGILTGGTESTDTIVENNILSNNATGISVFEGPGGSTVKSNTISQSSNTGINLNCSDNSIVENNVIYGTPVGVANVSTGDTISGNKFLNVAVDTTQCQQ